MTDGDTEAGTTDRYRTVFQESNDAILVLDPETSRILDCNPAATELLGYPREELRSLSPGAIHPHDYPTYEAFVEHVLDRGRGWTEELSCRTKRGDRVDVNVSASTADIDGERCLIVTLRDVSRLKRQSRELRRENDRLESVANILSHDLRNPLNVAMGRVQMARQGDGDDHLATAMEALERATDIVDNVSTLARQDATVQRDDLETVSLRELVENCWRNVETDAADLVVESDLTFRADTDRLRHVFENLFRNAIEHGTGPDPSDGDDSAVRIRVGRTETGFFVADDGPGIPGDEVESVFEAGVSSTSDGSGLGLHIVEQIAEAHGWTVDISRSQSGGARFDVRGVVES